MLIATRFVIKLYKGKKMSDTSERVQKIVVEHLGIDESKVNDSNIIEFIVNGSHRT